MLKFEEMVSTRNISLNIFNFFKKIEVISIKKLKLKDNNPKNYVVVDLDNDVSFIHDNNTGKNFFSNKMIAEACGTDESNVRRYWGNFKDKRTNVINSHVSLFTVNSDKPVDFKSFDFFNYVSNRVNTKESLRMQEYIADSIDEKFNRDVGFTKTIEPTKSLEKDVREIIQQLKTKVWEEATLAFEAKTKQEFNEHMDLADKYAMDVNKRELQLKNVINCNKRLKRESELNRHGILTESGNAKVFIPTNQTRLTDFSNNSIESKNKRRLL